jgi:hypothetical protein
MSDSNKRSLIFFFGILVAGMALYSWYGSTSTVPAAAEHEVVTPAQDPNISKPDISKVEAAVPAVAPREPAMAPTRKEIRPEDLAREIKDSEPWPGGSSFQMMDRWSLAPRLSAVANLADGKSRRTTLSGFAITESSQVMIDSLTAGGERPVVIDPESHRLGVVAGTIVVKLARANEAQSVASDFRMTLKTQRPELSMMVLEPAVGTRLGEAIARIRKDPRVRMAYLEVLTGDRRPR